MLLQMAASAFRLRKRCLSSSQQCCINHFDTFNFKKMQVIAAKEISVMHHFTNKLNKKKYKIPSSSNVKSSMGIAYML